MADADLVIRGGTVVDADGSRRADVAVADGVIVAVGEGLSGDRELDAGGCIVGPGLVDLHAHLREPGKEEAETVETGARAAARGGFTAVVAMPNTTPPIDSASVVREVQALARGALCAVHPAAALTVGRAGEQLTPMAELADLGVRLFTDDGNGVQDDRLMRRAMEYAGGLPQDVVLAQHCEVEALAEGGHMHEGAWSSRLGIPGIPAAAEELMVARDLVLARLTGARVHFQHMSTAGSVELIRRAKADGIRATAEVAPHHLTLTDAEVAAFDAVFKVNPPLREQADVDAVRAGLVDGTLDAVATDHAPHTQEDKEKPFDSAPPGMLGLETRPGHRPDRGRPARRGRLGRPLLAARGHRPPVRRARRPRRRGSPRQPLRHRPERRVDRRSCRHRQPLPQQPLRRSHPHRPGPPHDLPRRTRRHRHRAPTMIPSSVLVAPRRGRSRGSATRTIGGRG